MNSQRSFVRLVVTTLLCAIPSLVSSQATTLQSCLTAAGVRSIIKSNTTDTTWAKATEHFQNRIKVNPSCIAFPETRDEVAHSLQCARKISVKVTALGAAHSFQSYGFGYDGNLVISMAAFNSMTFDKSTNLLTYGGGSHVGPVAKYLWDNFGRHFPHVRGAYVGLAGSSIGGGFGSTSRHLGPSMDNIEAIEYMLYDGTIVNAAQGSDLLWAAKGAGASYGIILSVTTKTHKPAFETAINFTLSIGDVDVDTASKAFVAIQKFAMSSSCPDELALRCSLSAPPYRGKGYFYGDPTTFETAIAPLLSALSSITNMTTLAKSELSFWDMEVEIAGEGMNERDGGILDSRSFYTQSLTITSDYPLTVDLIRTLYKNTALAFKRTDLKRSGFLDLWGGVSRHVNDDDTAYPHGKILWLIRWEANSVDINTFPADGVTYMKSLMLPFEQALTEAGVPLRGYVNYADTELTEVEWSSRLYGANFERLKEIKAKIDPEGIFVNHAQSIPLPASSYSTL